MRIADLNAAEESVAKALAYGRRVDLRSGDAALDAPENAGEWGPERTIRADVLAELLLRPPQEGTAKRALRLHGARIVGQLGLAFAELDLPVMFHQCAFDERPDLYHARTRFLSFGECLLPGLVASNIQVEGNLRLSGCHSTGELRLVSGRISGNLLLNGARLANPGAKAIDAEHLDIASHLRAEDEFSCDGEIVLTAVRVGAAVVFDGARLHAPGGLAFGGSNIIVQVGLFGRSMEVDGEITLRSGHVSGPLTLRGSRITNPGAIAVRAGGLNAEGGFYLSLADVEGQVRMESAVIGRSLNLDGARLSDPGGMAVLADGVTVNGVLQARDGLTAEGEISLLDAAVSGPVRFEGATLINPGGRALSASGITVGKVFNLCSGFTARGRIKLTNARIGSSLCLDDATLETPGGEALRCWRLETRELAMRTATPIEGAVDLRHATIGVLRDDPDMWPEAIRMDGLSYEVLEPMLPAERRLRWLRRDPDGYLPNAYGQLAAMYQRLGNDADARDTLLASQRQRRGTLAWYARAWGHVQDVSVGYGYRPLRAASWLLALLTVGAVAFSMSEPAPLSIGQLPSFNPLIYTLDLLLPIIDFGQERAFSPAGPTQWLSYGLIAAGWVLATTIAAGLTRSLRRM
ncbi:hypothetical protein J5X84_16320 [Streptosporangiaceae bacterium NEAU-GS5]|nr:hypothetical protein [Streptosporangiaceae bacterium NEAU-GS5]